MQVLLIEDEQTMREMIKIYLQANGFEVREAEDGERALHILQDNRIDVIVLDLMMPRMDGAEFMRRYRKEQPVLMLTAKTSIEDKLLGFDLGADDYLTKPFDLRELAARIRALAMRGQPADSDGRFTLLHASHSLQWEGQVIPLTPKEFEILDLLSRRPERVFSRDELLLMIWEGDFEGDLRVVDTHVKNVREKCKRAGIACNPIQTVWGVGYRLGACES